MLQSGELIPLWSILPSYMLAPNARDVGAGRALSFCPSRPRCPVATAPSRLRFVPSRSRPSPAGKAQAAANIQSSAPSRVRSTRPLDPKPPADHLTIHEPDKHHPKQRLE